MVLDAVSNFVRGNTDAEVGTDDTTVSVSDASIFPDPETDGEFNVVIWDVNNFPRPDQDGDVEILRVTERDTTADELTVTRGQEMTSAAAHPEGSAIHLSPTAKMFIDIETTFGDFWDAGTQELTADVNNTNTTTTALEAESVSAGDLDTKTIHREGIHFAGEFDGDSADDRLSNAVDELEDDETIFLENARYSSDLTFPDNRYALIGFATNAFSIGTGGYGFEDGTWTITQRCLLQNIAIAGDAELIIDSGANRSRIFGCYMEGEITIRDDSVVLSNIVRVGSITFESGTEGGEIGVVSGGVTVTDNGNNSIL